MAKHTKKSHSVKPILLTVLGFVALSAITLWLLQGKDIALLNPKGFVANEQFRLLIVSTLIMLEIAIPALFLFYYFAWRYREGNENVARDPSAGQGPFMSVAIWLFPIITALLLVIVLVPATFKLEPQRPVNGAENPMRIQVVALRWKWLFIYPEQNIATVNYAQIPVHTPVQFELTADETPMSSFWIPHLGGMLYAMTGHSNRLNLQADTLGNYEGSAAEINGAGFAAMRFNTRVSTPEEFDAWVRQVQSSPTALTSEEYQQLLAPSEKHPVMLFANPDPDLYSTILSRYTGSHEHEVVPVHYKGAH